MTTQIGPWEVIYAEYWSANSIYLSFVPTPFGNAIILSDYDTHWNDIFTSGIYIRPLKPSPYHIYDTLVGANGAWVVDYDLFNPALSEFLPVHANQASAVPVTFDVITIVNSEEIRRDLATRIIYLESKNEDIEIDYKADDEFVKVRLADLEGLLVEAGDVKKNSDAAEAWVRAKHLVTPYEFLQEAYDDFDAQFAILQGE